jgi:hypothetical protein
MGKKQKTEQSERLQDILGEPLPSKMLPDSFFSSTGA